MPSAIPLAYPASAFSVGQLDVSDLADQAVHLFPLAVAGIIVWSLWIYRVVLSRRARPVVSDHRTTTSVVVPSFHEDPTSSCGASTPGCRRTRPR